MGEGKGKKSFQTEREANPQETLKYREQTEGCWRGAGLGGWTKWVMGIKQDTCWDENWVLYVSDESLNFTPETNIILC